MAQNEKGPGGLEYTTGAPSRSRVLGATPDPRLLRAAAAGPGCTPFTYAQVIIMSRAAQSASIATAPPYITQRATRHIHVCSSKRNIVTSATM